MKFNQQILIENFYKDLTKQEIKSIENKKLKNSKLFYIIISHILKLENNKITKDLYPIFIKIHPEFKEYSENLIELFPKKYQKSLRSFKKTEIFEIICLITANILVKTKTINKKEYIKILSKIKKAPSFFKFALEHILGKITKKEYDKVLKLIINNT